MSTSLNRLNIGERVRVKGQNYAIVRTGVEVQQLTVHRAESQENQSYFAITATINEINATTPCLQFNSSSNDIKSALNGLSIIVIGGVTVYESDYTRGIPGSEKY